MNDKVKDQIVILYDEGKEILKKVLDEKDKTKAKIDIRDYQKWYSKAELLVKQCNPTRYEEFISYYNSPKRKEMTVENYTLQDYFLGISVSRNGVQVFDTFSVALQKFYTQLMIIESIKTNSDNVLFNIKTSLECEVMDNEILSSRKLLKMGYLRSSGAICGVILEKHFSIIVTNHKLSIIKKDPCISDYNDLLKKEGVYDIVSWRFIQHLGDIRNICDHNKDREPTKDEVEDLINGTDKVVKTIF